SYGGPREKKSTRGPNPKSETRNPNEARNPNDETNPSASSFGFRHSGLIRASGFGFRVSVPVCLLSFSSYVDHPMLTLARRLLPVLQLTRMALVFTAIADSAAELLLRAKWESLANDSAHRYYHYVSAAEIFAIAVMSLGLIRFFHATVPAPHLPLVWHPLVLLNHVVILSTVAYRWEDKRPALTPIHYAGVFGGLAFMDLLAIALVWDRRTAHGGATF